jgi:hypothetical protein
MLGSLASKRSARLGKQNKKQANYINALAVSVLPFFEPAMPMTLGGLFVTLCGFWYDIG